MRTVAERFANLLGLAISLAPQTIQRSRLGRRILDEIALRERYRIGRRFTAAVQAWLAPNHGHTMYETWLDYALSTNLRGALVVEQLRRHKAVLGSRALDIGCAYGGFSIAFAEAGGEAVGIDIDANLLGFAAMNVLDRRAAVTLAHVDVTDRGRMCELGRFDFVTCSDVIEHVADVPATLENLAAALHPGGLLHLQIPNGRSAGLVLADGHFHAFGITLLERTHALRYFAEGQFGGRYDVESYLPLDDYFAMLARFAVRTPGSGVQIVPADATAALACVAARCDEIDAVRLRVAADTRFSAATRDAIAVAVERYLEQVRRALAGLRDERDEARRRALETELVTRYAIECWDVVARKDG